MMRKVAWATLSMALLWMLGTAAAHADASHSIALQLPDCAMLVSADGEPLTERGAYSLIVSISEGDVPAGEELFLATPSYDEVESGLSLLMDSKGEALTDPVYDQLLDWDGLIFHQRNGLQGVMDRHLSPIVPCNYYMLAPNGEGGYLGIDTDPYDDRPDGVYYIDSAGVESATGVLVLSGLGEFSEGLCTATSAESGRVGYLDTQGNWAIQAQLEYGGAFKNGRAEACIESGYGIIDRKGNWLLTPKYTLVSTGFGDGNMILAAEDNSKVRLIDPNTYLVKRTFEGEEVYFSSYFDRDYVTLYTTDSVQLIDEDGEVLMETSREGSFDAWYKMGDRVIKRDGPWGEVNNYLMDTKGNEIAGPYRELTLLGLDEDDQPCFAFSDFEVAEQQSSGDEEPELWEVPGTRRGGVIDRNGNVLIEVGEFVRLEDAGGGRLIAETLTEVGVVDYRGEWIAQFPKENDDWAQMDEALPDL